MAPTGSTVIDVTDETFASEVLQESKRRPVVVDFWAAWCQPCRIIGPVLERLAEEAAGDFLLAKLDVDSNPRAAAEYGIQGIPAVKAFRDGVVVDEFVGAVPEQAIRQFLGSLVPSAADRLAERAEEAEQRGSLDEAEDLFRQALVAHRDHPRARLGLGRLALQRDDLAEARRLLEPLRPHAEAERLLAAVEISEWTSAATTSNGRLREAQTAAAEGRFVEALNGFLGEVLSGGQDRDIARDAMLKLFAVLGDEDPLTREYRRRLAAALF